MMSATLTPAPAEALEGEAPLAAAPLAEPVARRHASSWTLLRQAAGGPVQLARKLGRLGSGLLGYLRPGRIPARLERLRALGVIDVVPTRVQLFVGSLDMMRFWISPAAADYYRSIGISYGFHQVLRFLDEPLSLTDPLGLLSERDAIITHLMQVVHANPHYDLELLLCHEDGVEELCRQLEAMLAGTHPRAASIGAIVEEPDYHARLLAYARAWMADRFIPPPLRENVAADPRWAELEGTFGTLRGSLRYFATLPTTPWGALRHLRRVRAFPGAPA